MLSNYTAGGAENNYQKFVRSVGSDTELEIRDLGKGDLVGPEAGQDDVQ
jgi:hypothetical protein